MKVTLEVSKLIKLENYAGSSVIVLVNDEPAWPSTVLQENDTLKLIPMITGG